MWYLTAPGYVVAVASYAGYLGLAAAIAPAGRWRRLALPAALTVAEAIRFVFPFGGVPLASLGISQALSPLEPDRPARRRDPHHVAHVHGRQRARRRRGSDRGGRPSCSRSCPLALIALGAVAPSGHDTGRSLTVALVQGGGPQGTRAADTDPQVVFERHLAATRLIDEPVDLVVWPENVIDVDGVPFADSAERARGGGRGSPARRTRSPSASRRTPATRFTNAQVVVAPGRDDHQPLRQGAAGPLRRVHAAARPAARRVGAPTDLVPRDARARHRARP